jgi:hypothetical protein
MSGLHCTLWKTLWFGTQNLGGLELSCTHVLYIQRYYRKNKEDGTHNLKYSRKAISCRVVLRMDSWSFQNFGLSVVLKYLLCLFMAESNWIFVSAFVYFLPVPQTRTCFLKNHLKCMGIWNDMFECKRIRGVCLFFVVHHWMVECYVYSWL